MRYLLAFDVETPNPQNNRICSIGLAKITEEGVTETASILIDPECEFGHVNRMKNGIRPEQVAGKPNFKQFWKTYGSWFSESDCLVAHNARFDLSVLSKTLQAYGLPRPMVKYIDTQIAAKACFPALNRFGLEPLCEYLDIELNHHEAGSDAKACAQVFLEMIAMDIHLDDIVLDYDLNVDWDEHVPFQAHLSENSKVLNELQALLRDITEDGIIDQDEFDRLEQWIKDHAEFKGQFPYNIIKNAIDTILEDGIIEPSELDWLYDICKSGIDPLSSQARNREIDFKDKLFCLTGEFDLGSKGDAALLIAKAGGQIADDVVQKLDYLIVGAQGNGAWLCQNFGTKIKRALEYQMKGLPIRIVVEKDFIAALKAANIAIECSQPVPPEVEEELDAPQDTLTDDDEIQISPEELAEYIESDTAKPESVSPVVESDIESDVSEEETSKTKRRKRRFKRESVGVLELLAYLKEIIADGVVDTYELEALATWMEEHPELDGKFPYNLIFYALEKILEDNVIEPEELVWICEIFQTCVNPIESLPEDQIIGIKGKLFCLSGIFKIGQPDEIMRMIVQLGGDVKDGIMKKTDYLVIGASSNESVEDGNYGVKIKRAIEWKVKGQPIRIISESDLTKALEAAIEE